MTRVLIISTSTKEQYLLEDALQARGDTSQYKIDVTASFAQSKEWWLEEGPDVLVIEFPEDDMLQGYFFNKLRKEVPETMPTIFVTPTVTAQVMALNNHLKKVRILKSPFTKEALLKTLDDISTKRTSEKEQVHPRYSTEQEVQVDGVGLTQSLRMTMKNISKGGALLECESDPELKPGSLLKVKIGLKDVNKFYQFDVKVVWTRQEQNLLIGVAFVGKDDVYNYLIKQS